MIVIGLTGSIGMGKSKAASMMKIMGVPVHVSIEEIRRIVWFEPANAVKVVMPRRIVSGAPGDADVYGAQQHAPLLGLNFDL